MSDKRLELTRRKALMGLGGIGTGAALGGTGTMAFLNDEESSRDNMMTAGTLDLQLDWYTFYKGSQMDDDYQTQNGENDPMLSLNDVKPGDYGCGVIGVHVEGNPAHVWHRTKNAEQGEGDPKQIEPEAEVDSTPNKGDLAKHVKFVAAPLGCFDEGDYDGESTVMNNLPHEKGSRPSMDDWTTDKSEANNNSNKNYCYTKGTLAEALYEFRCGKYLDANDKNTTCLYGFCWWVPKKVGNVIQGDTVEFDLEFYAEQQRHNQNPDNPWAETYSAPYINDSDNSTQIEGTLEMDVCHGEDESVYRIQMDDDSEGPKMSDPLNSKTNIWVPFDTDDDGTMDFQLQWYPGGDLPDDPFGYKEYSGSWESTQDLPSGVRAMKSGEYVTFVVPNSYLNSTYRVGAHMSAGGEAPYAAISTHSSTGEIVPNGDFSSSEYLHEIDR